MNETVRLPDFEALGCYLSPIGSMTIETVRGKVDAVEVPGITTMLLERPSGPSIGIMTYDHGEHAGVFVQVNEPLARSLALSLIALADMLASPEVN